MRAYSQELRYQVLRAIDEGTAREEIIAQLHVSRATIKRYLKQRRETGYVLPRPIPGRPPKKKAALLLGIPALLEAHPEASQREYYQWWEEEHGMQWTRRGLFGPRSPIASQHDPRLQPSTNRPQGSWPGHLEPLVVSLADFFYGGNLSRRYSAESFLASSSSL
ncbi:MAG: helix-turn-helix domain-containing protein [Ktedonobacteraceae bacterium]|nr:helix-turn-helix domain-containing protein [Ktedonobacteraceae bacterium]